MTKLPVEWNEWQDEWRAWRQGHASDLCPTDQRIEGKNVLSDGRLGTWRVRGRDVELDEVVFDIQGTERAIGVTFVSPRSAQLAFSFAELEQLLGVDNA